MNGHDRYGARVLEYYQRLDATHRIPRELCWADMRTYVSGGPGLTIEEADRFGAEFYRAIPDLKHLVEAQFEAGCDVATRLTLRGVHSGPFGEAPPTGAKVVVSSIVLHRFDANYLLEAQWLETDQAGLLGQLGLS